MMHPKKITNLQITIDIINFTTKKLISPFSSDIGIRNLAYIKLPSHDKMPPKKAVDKKEVPKAKGDEAVEMILDYLQKQNRPYSATDISANLHNAVTKANAVKLLKELSDNGDLVVCISGKQMVYHTPQDPDDFASPEEIAAMKTLVEVMKERTSTLKAELKSLQVTLQNLRSMPTADDLKSEVGTLQREVTDLRSRLEPLRSGDVKPISAEEKQKVQMEAKKMQGLWIARKRWSKEFFEAVADGLGGDVNLKDLKVSYTHPFIV
ncbi:hypothetical protein EYR41_011914 [Orbilia oligospora]|uniref:Uncharacterized protein n=1 Tax=Orbilia oligospora TaxID=2813651 RepID=A0A7C8P5Q5_ORBOL|nr:hypothetical protein TWF751_008205 [Orbilia oligospora]TGJ62727.1 hypothetical protein EYR41_011914 [Orbilia oligospora]